MATGTPACATRGAIPGGWQRMSKTSPKMKFSGAQSSGLMQDKKSSTSSKRIIHTSHQKSIEGIDMAHNHKRLIAEYAKQSKPLFTNSDQAIYAYLDDEHLVCNEKFSSLLGYTSPKEF